MSQIADPSEPCWLYIDLRGAQRGPVSENDIKWLIAAGQINTQTYGWKADLKDWVIMSQYPQLYPCFVEVGSMEEAWFYMDSQIRKQGPFDQEVLLQLYKSAQINDNTAVWKTGQTGWKPVHSHDELSLLVKDIQPLSFDEALPAPAPTTTLHPDTLVHLDSYEATTDDTTKDSAGVVVKTSGVKLDSELTEEERAKREANREKKRKQKENISIARAQQTSVYVTGLPNDITIDEMFNYFKKAGLLKEDDDGVPKIKLYKDEQGRLKGDGVVHYLKEESVSMAVEYLDGGEIRTGHKLTVKRAEYTKKEVADTQLSQAKKAKRKLHHQAQAQALSWNENIDEVGGGLKIVVIKHICDVQEAKDSGDFDEYYANMKEEIFQECETKCGKVEKVSVFPRNPIGPVVIKFKGSSGAQNCVELMNKRFFGGRQLVCEYYDGTNYKVDYDNDEEEKRLKNFGDWLEGKAGSEQPESKPQE